MLWYCDGCTAAYAVGLEHCPQCGKSSKEAAAEAEQRPKRQATRKNERTDDTPTADR